MFNKKQYKLEKKTLKFVITKIKSLTKIAKNYLKKQ